MTEQPSHQLVTEAPFVVLDFETVTPAGRSPEPMELATMRLAPGLTIDLDFRLSWLICPPADVPLTAFDTRQTGIRTQDIEHAPNAATVLRAFDERLQAETPLVVAHNAHYEAAIVQRSAAVCPHVATLPFLDTVALGKYFVPSLDNYKLDTLAQHFGLPIPAQRHRALPDVELTVQIFLRLLHQHLERLPQMTVTNLLQIAGITWKGYRMPPCKCNYGSVSMYFRGEWPPEARPSLEGERNEKNTSRHPYEMRAF